MNHTPKPKSKWYWRLLRWGLIGLAVLVTLAGVLVTEENWRAKRAWQAYKHAAEARGDRLDLAGVIPAPIPDDQNFFAAPIVAEALAATTSPDKSGVRIPHRLKFELFRGDSGAWPTNGGNLQRGRFDDLAEWQRYFRKFNETPEGRTNGFSVPETPQTPAEDILQTLGGWDTALEELRQASLRPGARLPLPYENGFDAANTMMPWLAEEKSYARLLHLRAAAELNAGQNAQALDDIRLLFKLTDSTRNVPFLITHLVRIAMTSIALQPIYEGLAQHHWDDAQLVALESILAGQDYLADFQLAMRGERTCAIDAEEKQRLTRQVITPANVEGTQWMTNSLWGTPAAFFYRTELAFARMYDVHILPLADVSKQTVSLSVSRAGQQYYQEATNHLSLYSIQAVMLFPAVNKSILKFAAAQSDINLARVACALERYHLAHNEYPASLEAVTPAYLTEAPHDIINGQPLHYRRTDDGLFMLYSVGWNETDDGGKVAVMKSGSTDRQQGDWVWQYRSQ